MNFNVFQWRSIKTKMTITTLGIFMISIWSLEFHVSRTLREDIQHLSGEQQFSVVSFIAAGVNEDIDNRLRSLEKIAEQVTSAILGNPVALQALLEQRPIIQILFNGGAFVTGIDGTAIASIPLSVGRVGVNYMDRDFIAAALKEGKSTIGRPVMGKQMKSPIFVTGVPIRDAQGNVIGALAGVTDLSKPNFLDKIVKGRYGETGGYLLVAPQYRLIVTTSDKNRIMEVLPGPGINPFIDRFIQGYEGSAVGVNPVGVEVLSSAKGIPVSGWYVAVTLPIQEAFAPIRAMQQRILLATILITLLAGGLTWWMLKRQLAPVFATIKTLATLADSDQTQQPLSIARQDEIGALIGGFNRLLETLGQREEALKESEEKYRTLIQKIQIAVVVHGPDTRILTCNPMAQALLGLTEDQILGKTAIDPAWHFFHDDGTVMSVEEYPVNQVIARRQAVRNFIVGVHRPGKEQENDVWVLINADPVFVNEAEIVQVIVTFIDITELKRAEEEIKTKNEELENYLYIASHDLRSPLVNLQGFSQRLQKQAVSIKTLLSDTILEPETKNGIEKITDEGIPRTLNFIISNVTKMDVLLNGLLQISRTGRTVMTIKKIDMNQLFKTVIGTYNHQLIELDATVTAAELPFCHGDENLINQVISNIIGNAIKYREKGKTLAIDISAHQEFNKVIYSIKDNGIGIDPRHLAKIWNVFYRVDPDSGDAGDGLGLSIVKRIVDKQKGRVWAESELGKGSIFFIELQSKDFQG